jgi:hypothetical protein
VSSILLRSRVPAAIVLGAALAAATVAPVAAASPGGGCPPGGGFAWATIDDIVALYPMIPPAALQIIDVNGNGALCFVHAAKKPAIRVIDDAVPAGAGPASGQ